MTDMQIQIPAPTNPNEGILEIAKALRETSDRNHSEQKAMYDTVQKDFDKYVKESEEMKAKMLEQKKELENQKSIIAALERHVAVNKDSKSETSKSFDADLTYVFEKMITCDSHQYPIVKSEKKFLESLTNVVAKKDNMLLPELKSVFSFMKAPRDTNVEDFSFSKKYIRTDIDDQGGYLVPPEFSLTLLKRGTEWSPIRQHANVMQTYSNMMHIPVRNVLTDAYMEWEQVPSTNSSSKSQSQYNRETVYMKRMGVKTQLTHEMILYSPFDIQSLVSNDVVERFTQKEGSLFINGGGSINSPNEVEGILSNTNVTQYVSSHTSLNADDVLKMQAAIKWNIVGQSEYDRMYIMNKKTLLELLSLKTGTGFYLWQITALENGYPNKIGGYDYLICPDMPDVASGATPIVMGDLKRAYTIVDRLALYMVRDDVTDPPNVNLSFFKYFGAKVVLPEALVKLVLA